MDKFDYKDWQLNGNKKISSEHASGYIEKIVKDKLEIDKKAS
jgi:hypothetical protein